MYKYDIALSYQSKSEKLVQAVSNYLKSEGWNVFFAPNNKKELLSENLNSKLFQVYQNESLVKVLFITKEYLNSEYTQLELRRSLSSSQDNERRLIVVNFIGESIPEELKPYVYLEGTGCEDEIAFQISERVKELKGTKSKLEKTEQENEMFTCNIQNINYVKNNKGIVSGGTINIGHIDIN